MRKQMMMKNLLVLVGLSLGTFCFAEAQTFYWGYTAALDDETEKAVSHTVTDEEVIRITSRYDLDIFNYRINADVFSRDNFEKTGGADLGIEQPVMGSASATHQSMHQREGTDFVFFQRETDRSTSENNLYAQSVDIATGKRSERQLLTAIEGKNNSNNGQFLTAASENGAYFAVLKEPAFYRKTPEKIEIILYDASLNALTSIEHTFDSEADRVPKHMLNVDDQGNVYLVKRFDLKKQKPFHSIFVWKRNSTDLVETSLRQDDDYQAAQIYPHFHGGNTYFTVLLTHEGSTTFGMKVDMDGRHSGTSGSGLLCLAFSPEGTHLYTKRNDFDIVSNLSVKEILSEGDRHWVVMERMNSEKKSSSSDPLATNVTHTYTYLSNGFMVALINAETGSMAWTKTIDTAEPDTRNDNGAFLSALPLLHEGRLVMLYNETREFPDVNNRTYRKRVPIMEVTDLSGKSVSRTALTDAGVGVKKDEPFDLDTAHIIPLGKNKYVVRARKGSSAVFKYGTLQM